MEEPLHELEVPTPQSAIAHTATFVNIPFRRVDKSPVTSWSPLIGDWCIAEHIDPSPPGRVEHENGSLMKELLAIPFAHARLWEVSSKGVCPYRYFVLTHP